MTSPPSMRNEGTSVRTRPSNRPRPPTNTTRVKRRKRPVLISMFGIALQKQRPMPTRRPDRYRKWLSPDTLTVSLVRAGPNSTPYSPVANGTMLNNPTVCWSSRFSRVRLGMGSLDLVFWLFREPWQFARFGRLGAAGGRQQVSRRSDACRFQAQGPFGADL